MAYIGNFGNRRNAGYSIEATKQLFGTETPELVMVSSAIQHVNAWDDQSHGYTDQVDHCTVMVASEGVEPFAVKLPAGVKTDAGFLDHVVFGDLETYQNGSRVYFRAKNVKKVQA